MAKYFRMMAIFACLSVAGGCGTCANLEGKNLPALAPGKQYEPVAFGGVRNDIRWCHSISLLFLLDLPLSIAGDVITLPLLKKQQAGPLPSRSYSAVEVGEDR